METKTMRVTAKELAYTEIKRKIITCEFLPSQAILEEELAKELQISRTPLRGALQQLEYEKLVTRKPNGRLITTPVSVQEVRELFVVRSKLEGLVVTEVVDNITEKDIDQLKHLVDMVKISTELGDYEKLDQFGGGFHTTLYHLSYNQTLTNTLYQLNDRINRYRRIAHLEVSKQSAKEHEEILSFIINKDKENAEKAMNNHILNAMNHSIEAISKYTNDSD